MSNERIKVQSYKVTDLLSRFNVNVAKKTIKPSIGTTIVKNKKPSRAMENTNSH